MLGTSAVRFSILAFGVPPMNLPLLATLSFNLLLAVAMLVRETSLRRSLQRLLRRLLSFWRNAHEETHPQDAGRHPDHRRDGLYFIGCPKSNGGCTWTWMNKARTEMKSTLPLGCRLFRTGFGKSPKRWLLVKRRATLPGSFACRPVGSLRFAAS